MRAIHAVSRKVYTAALHHGCPGQARAWQNGDTLMRNRAGNS